jgi:hypothetical protein
MGEPDGPEPLYGQQDDPYPPNMHSAERCNSPPSPRADTPFGRNIRAAHLEHRGACAYRGEKAFARPTPFQGTGEGQDPPVTERRPGLLQDHKCQI